MHEDLVLLPVLFPPTATMVGLSLFDPSACFVKRSLLEFAKEFARPQPLLTSSRELLRLPLALP